MSYAGIGGHYWGENALISRGSYMLDEAWDIVFGEPVCVIGTGTTAVPQNKKWVKSYDAAPGAEDTIGVSIEWRRAISTWDAEDMALHGRQDFKRDLSILKRGGCTVRNIGTGIIYDGQRVVPANGGCALMTITGQHSLGIAKQDIQPGQYGLIDVQPDEEKPFA